MSIILGINAYHADSSACLLVDGELVAAIEEERLTRVKHWSGFPQESILFVLEQAGLEIGDLTHVAVNSDNRASLSEKAKYMLAQKASWGLIRSRLKNRGHRHSVRAQLARINNERALSATFVPVEHHLAHGAACWYTSPFNDAAVVSVDGFGDFCSTMIASGSATSLNSRRRVNFPHSLGVFYQAITQFLGFENYGDEFKVMGLAAYGEPVYLNLLNDVVRLRNNGDYELNMRYFVHGSREIFSIDETGKPVFKALYSEQLERLLGAKRQPGDPVLEQHHNLASSVQCRYEEVLFHVLRQAHEDTESDNLCLSGGCAMNSVANGRITQMTAFNNVYIQPAAGDSGGALGAALWTYHNAVQRKKRYVQSVATRTARFVRSTLASSARRSMHTAWDSTTHVHQSVNESDPERARASTRAHYFSPYLGPEYSDDELAKATQTHTGAPVDNALQPCEFENDAALLEWVATQISDGAVVAWFQGRLEWGARALGNRSILADPRRADMRDILNSKIKQREDFRPFAPSVLAEAVDDWFETDQTIENDHYVEAADLHAYMMSTCAVRSSRREQIPAVTHVDGSARPQSVHASINPRFHQLISAFAHVTGVPMLVNTSFNENEPIVCTPADAVACFARTEIDILVLGTHVVHRHASVRSVSPQRSSLIDASNRVQPLHQTPWASIDPVDEGAA